MKFRNNIIIESSVLYNLFIYCMFLVVIIAGLSQFISLYNIRKLDIVYSTFDSLKFLFM